MDFLPNNTDFQTPAVVADYMVSLLDSDMLEIENILEPTPGNCNLVNAILKRGYSAFYPRNNQDFWDSWENKIHKSIPYDAVIMNPPFFPIKEMERFVLRSMELSNTVIALLPWIYMVNSERRLNALKDFGILSITNLPRKTFPGARVQTCIIHMKKGSTQDSIFKTFSFD